MNKTSYVSALAAFVMWGSWAYWVNSGAGVSAGVLAGLVQGTSSFVITLFMVRMATFFFAKLQDAPLAWCWSAVLTVGCTGTGLFAIHTLAATTDILRTITPALLVALAFCLYTTWTLKQQ